MRDRSLYLKDILHAIESIEAFTGYRPQAVKIAEELKQAVKRELMG